MGRSAGWASCPGKIVLSCRRVIRRQKNHADDQQCRCPQPGVYLDFETVTKSPKGVSNVEKTHVYHGGVLCDWNGRRSGCPGFWGSHQQYFVWINASDLPAFSCADDGMDGKRS